MKNFIILLFIFLALLVINHFGMNWQTVWALILTAGLLMLAMIDWQHQLLPDQITLPLLWFGLLLNFWGMFCSIQAAVLGAIVGYSSLWLFAWIFQRITGKVGMGHGDFKLLAMLGAWIGWQALPFIILIASVSGSIIGIGLIIFGKQERHAPLAFGPYLALAGWIALIWGA